MNSSLLTGATQGQIEKRLDNLSDQVQRHLDAGFEAHKGTVKLNAIWECTNGDDVNNSKTLQLGATLDGSSVFVTVPVVQ